ncbi:hypothetical protein, variant 1 [Aphanomyces invadans]|uniref:Kinesin-like protein n=1 Tax=Aphanomyces invadans TaxID=157072 RepID=A0A024ULR4_9STRA|nr:hypothetical protein, variant 1 [Aphanomyces invadans]ETW06553.1 hypothetical protein, variant 1 [Aphanomyces invadans]|eukprot:XP_008864628.1 hypothetical protein, variant 1 [Aphanomyces invadans]
MQRTPRGVAAAISPGSPLRRADSMSPTNHSNPLYASTSPMGSVTSRRESDQRRAQEAGMSLLGLAFDGGHMTPPTARSPSSYGGSPVTHQKTSFGIAQAQYDEHLAPLEGVDPNLFMEGVKEHAKYLGMDPQRDNDMLWIARESLVAPMPTGWHQIMTKEGVPYYYNDHTGESRWEHPSDQDYMALYQEVMRMKLAGEPIDVSRLKYQFVQRQALNTHQHHGAGLHLDDAWARSGSSGSYHIDTPTDPHDGYNQGQYEAWSQSSAPSRRRRPHSSSHGKLEDVESEYDDEAHECTGEDIPYSPRDDDDNGSDIQVTTTRRGGAALDDMPDDGHRALVESLYAQLNECKTKLELQQQHQDVVDALQKSLYDITGQLEAHVKEVASANEALKAVQDELATAMRDKHTSAQHVIELEDALKQSRQQLVLAQGEVEIAKAKEAQDNLALRQEVKTLTMRLHDAETSAAVDEVQKQLKKETKLRFQWEQKFKSLEEQHQALMIQVNDANRKHELDRHVAQGDVETYQNELAQSKAKLASEIQTISDNHAHELERVKHAMGMRHAQEIDELTREHDKQLKALQTSENALLATVRALEADRLTQSAALADSATQLQAVQREAAQSTRRIKQLEASETANVKQIASLQAELDALKTSVQAQMDQAKQAGIAEATAKMHAAVRAAVEEKDQLAQLYAQEMKARRQLHNRVMEMAGNIRVFCRIRPVSNVEVTSADSAQVVTFRPNDPHVLDLTVAEGQKHTFEFDYVFQPTTGQADVFEQTKALVVSAMDGFNVCIFAYGQTGSGKTHTMEGPATDRGVNFRAMDELFRVRDERVRSGNVECDMKLSILEVYNETIVDLLDDSPTGERKPLEVRMGKQGAYVENLMEVEVYSASDVDDLMKLGHSHRSVGSHDVNEHSSRSHLVVSITITSSHKLDGRKSLSKLHLIDLAGSERISKTAASGQRLKEAQHINRSLSALGDVIASLGGHSKHVPYRNSKLTFLLQESLSGNSKVLMFVNVSPVQWNAWESLCSLNFAQRCRNVALGQAKANTSITNGPNAATSVPKPAKAPSSKQGGTLTATEKVRVSLAPKSPKKDN